MSERNGMPSDIIEISRMNGDFKNNYRTLLGALLYLRSVSAARGRSLLWVGENRAVRYVLCTKDDLHGEAAFAARQVLSKSRSSLSRPRVRRTLGAGMFAE
jgi:hypothetical protein